MNEEEIRNAVGELCGYKREGNFVIYPDGRKGNVLDGCDFPPYTSCRDTAYQAKQEIVGCDNLPWFNALQETLWPHRKAKRACELLVGDIIDMMEAHPQKICSALLLFQQKQSE